MYLTMLLQYGGTIHLSNIVCTDHIDFPVLSAKLQVFSCTDFTYKTQFLF